MHEPKLSFLLPLGQLLGPILASQILSSEEPDAWNHVEISDVQFLHLIISGFISITAMMLLVSNKLGSKQAEPKFQGKYFQHLDKLFSILKLIPMTGIRRYG